MATPSNEMAMERAAWAIARRRFLATLRSVYALGAEYGIYGVHELPPAEARRRRARLNRVLADFGLARLTPDEEAEFG
jgi:hypothetical protein